MAKLIIDVTSKNINSTKKQVTELDKATEQLRLENIKLNKQLKSLDKTTADYAQEEKRLTKQIVDNTVAMRANKRESKELDNTVKDTSRSMSLQTKVVGALAVAYSTLQLKELTLDVISVGREFEALTVSLNASVGGAVQGAKAFSFLRKEADRLGIDLVASTKGFKELSASAKGTGIDALEVRNVFQSVSEAGAVMQLTTDDLNGTFRALSQIMSKGTVQAEELRGQLGERIPGAFQIASRAMGVTTQELGKMLEQGEVIADDFLPRFAEELKKTFGGDVANATDTLTASVNRFGNELKLLKVAIAESGLNDFAKTITEISTTIIKGANNILDAGRILKGSIDNLKNLEEIQLRRQKILAEINENSQLFGSTVFKSAKEQYRERIKALQEELNELNKRGAVLAKQEENARLAGIEAQKIAKEKKENALAEAKAKNAIAEANKKEIEQRKLLRDTLTTSLADWEIYYKEIGDYSTAWELQEAEIRKRYVDADKKALDELIQNRKENYFDVLQEETLDLIESEYDEREKREKQLADTKKRLAKDEEKQRKKDSDFKKEQIEYNKNLIGGYESLAGSIGDMFKEGSKEAQAFQTVQSALAVVNAVNAVLTQGQGDPYSAFARIATMTTIVAGLLSNIGQSISSSNTSTSSSFDTLSAQQANTGAGTVLGDTQAVSKSISDSLSILEDFAKPEFDLLSSMNKSLLSIDQKLGGVAGLLIRQGGFQFGAGFTPTSSSGQRLSIGSANIGGTEFSGSLGLLSALDPATQSVVQLEQKLLGGGLSSVISGLENKILGGLFGRTSSESTLADAGIIFGEQLLAQALDDFQGKAFQTIATTVTKKSWFSSSSSTSYTTSLQDLNEETERQFGLVLNTLFDTVVKAGEALGSTEAQIEADLSDFYVNIGKLSLKGKSGDQIQELLSNVFGKVGDDLAREAFPIVQNFQAVGEGLFNTLTRVATGMQEAEFFTDKLGVAFDRIAVSEILNTRGDVGFEALVQSILKGDRALFGFNNGISELIENFTGTTSELFETFTKLQDVRTQFQFLGSDIDGITASLVRGVGSTNSLNSALDNFIKGFFTAEEQLELNINRLDKEFAKLNLSVPNTKDEFKDLLLGIDLTTEAGQELYGRLVLLADTFADVAEEADGTIDKLNRKLKPFFNTLQDSLSSAFDSFVNLGNKAQNALNNLTSGTNQSQFQTLTNFNQLLADFNKSKQTTDFAQTEGLYNQLISVASGLGQDSTYTEAVRGFLSGNIQEFDAQKDTLRVNIVDGLQELLGLNQEQTLSLQKSVQDGEITNQELANIQGLTVEQKDGIIKTAENSSLFSTEKTLSSLEQLSQLQLEDLRKAREEESEALSSKTFRFGDTVGTQEQKDISSLLGTPFENVSPLIESLQNLNISQDRTADLKNILGFSGTSINEGVFGNIQKLSPFLNGIGAEAQNIKFEAETNNFNDRLSATTDSFNQTSGAYNSSKTSLFSALSRLSIATTGDVDRGIGYSFTGTDEGDFQGNYNRYKTAFDNTFALKKQKDQLQKALINLNREKIEKGFADGGFTGFGGKYDVAGQVHRGEYVVNQEQLAGVGGAAGMEVMLKNGNKALIETNQNLVQLNISLLKKVNELTRMFKQVSQGGRILSVSLDE